jgi:two-component system chemotaxis response regulator CheB
MTRIRVVVVDDSITVRERLVEILAREVDIEVVGQAANGRRAVELTAALRPDVVTLDIVMPDMTGLSATEQIMAHHPTPILIVSSSFNRGELFDTYSALAAGAVDVLEKPNLDSDDPWEPRFLDAVRMVAKIKVITQPRARLAMLGQARKAVAPVASAPAQVDARVHARVVAIGASTGGPAALATVLGAIAPSYPHPMIVVLHIDTRFAPAFADWLGTQTRHRVRLAAHGERLDAAAGVVLVAPADCHLTVRGGVVELVDSPPRNHCKPSIDVLFESLAMEYGQGCAACLLTGMGRDGAAGLLAIRKAGGFTIGQDEASSVIYGMPREACAIGAVERQLALDDIGPALDALRAWKEAR